MRLFKSIFLSIALACSAHAQATFQSASLQNANVGTNATAGGGGGGGDTIWLTLTSAGTSRNNFDGTVGCKFTVNSTITVTSVARYVISGSTQSHRVGIWDSGFTKLAEVTVNASGLGTGFAYVSLGTPVTLTSGNYYIGTEEFSGGDSFLNDDSTISTTGVATITTSSFASGAYDAPFNLATSGVFSFGPVNFKYH